MHAGCSLVSAEISHGFRTFLKCLILLVDPVFARQIRANDHGFRPSVGDDWCVRMSHSHQDFFTTSKKSLTLWFNSQY